MSNDVCVTGSSSGSFLEQLRVYKQVCHKIRSSLVAGRDEIVSPCSLSRALIDSRENFGGSGSIDSGIFPGEAPSAESPGGAQAGRPSSRNSECPFIEAAEGWSVEYCEKYCEQCGTDSLCVCSRPAPCLKLRQLVEAAYRENFHQQSHTNYFAEESDIGPCILSVKQEGDCDQFRLLLRSSDHYLHGVVSGAELCGVKSVSKDDVVSAVSKEMGLSTSFKPALLPDIEKELLRVDETFVKAHHKVGVLRVKEGQRSEEEIFANNQEPGCFEEFLNVLGSRVRLRGFNKFLGGLDNERDLTGQESVFTEHQGLEIMFHVSALLPYTPNDSQQVNKKRHIGNDIVCIVFLDSAHTVFNPTWIRSNFIHCYVVVQHVLGAHGQPLYKIAVTTRSTVPSFSPSLRHTGVFAHSKTLQSFLLAKVINGERASYHAPRFLKLTNRSRGQLLHELSASLTEYNMATKQGRATRKILKRSNWLPIGASRPPSPPMDSVREKYVNTDKLAEDFSVALRGCELADVMFIVGEEKIALYGVKAVLACRSRVFRTMFKESKPNSRDRLSSPLVRKRNVTCHGQYMSPQASRKTKLTGLSRMKKKGSVPDDLIPALGADTANASNSFSEDPRNMQIKEHYVIEGFTDTIFSELLAYLMTGGCAICHTNVVGLACAAEQYEVAELKQACHDQLPQCLSIKTVFTILTQLEKYLAYASAKSMIIRCLEFVDNNAFDILRSEEMLSLSENMVHLVLRRDTDVPEILKVKAAFAWGEVNAKQGGPDFKTLVTPLVKHVRLHLIDPQELMKTVVPTGIFENDKVMAALAYQVDPQSVEQNNFTMFRPRKKSSVLSSR